MIRSILFTDGANPKYNISTEEIARSYNDPRNLLWISLENPGPEEFSLLRNVFNFHPLAIEDSMNVGYQAPKVDDYEDYLFIIMHAVDPNQDFHELVTHELNLFLGPSYLVTVYAGERIQAIDTVFQRIEKDQRLAKNGSDFLCHAVLDVLVDDYMPIIDHMEDEIDWLEDQVIAHPQTRAMDRIIRLKHAIMTLRRIISPMREVVNRLSRDEYPMIDQQSRLYFRDVYDHLVRIQDLSDTIRDIVTGTMDIYLNATSLRLNEVMKALTIVSTIFLPLSFLAGVYGMNFQRQFPAYEADHGIIVFWLICFLVAVGMLAFFKRRGWF